MTTYLEIDEAELSSMWETEWADYAASVMGIPVQSIAHVTYLDGCLVVTEA
jgi:hypothetical protein